MEELALPENRYEALCFILNANVGSRVLQYAKQIGSSGGTIIYGNGTINNSILKMFGLEDVRKELVIMAIPSSLKALIIETIGKKLKLEKANNGISFSLPITNIIGNRKCQYHKAPLSRKEESLMHQAIITIVDQGQAEEVIDAAVSAGSQGGTVLNGRGSGSHEKAKLFSMDVEPEKEIVLILSQSDSTDDIVAAINQQLKIEEPGNGILFTVDLSSTLGLF